MLKPKPENIPQELKALDSWVCWRSELRDEKQTKVPYNAKTGGLAKSNDPVTWADFTTAYKHYQGNGFNGVGFVLSADDPFVGIDLDHCVDPESGKIEPWAQKIVDGLSTYCERSPSGTGLRAFVKGVLPQGGRKKGDIELYESVRYLTVTGHSLNGYKIEKRQKELEKLHVEIFPAKKAETKNQPVRQMFDNHELLAKAFESKHGDKIRRLYNGDFSDYSSQSEADQALCNYLAFWFNRDYQVIDSVFRSSGLMRDKWDEKHFSSGETYGSRTIVKAINATETAYQDAQRPTKKRIEAAFKEEKKRDYHFTDMGNAERLVDLHGQDFRYCYPFKRWFVWDGKRWNGDNVGLLRRMCKDMIKDMYKEASEMDDDKARKALLQYAFKCETVKKSRDMMEFAQSEDGIPILPKHLDKDIYLINCLNGTVNLRTGELRPHRRDDLITKLVHANYNPDAKCPMWLAHLNKIMAGSDNLIQFLQKAFGYSLTGDTSERILFFQWGSGANGKTITNDTVAMVMCDYAMRTPTETLLTKRNDGIPSDVARLKGARFVYASEAEQGKRLAESLIKDMSGGDKITARFLHQEWFEFYPEFKIWLGTNHKPIIRGTDLAIWDRIRLIPFAVRIPGHEQIPKTEMLEQFQDEIDGIFSWLVKGCLAWQQEGLGMPEEVKAAITDYRKEMDVLTDFLDERCIFRENCTVSAKELYSEYVKWAKENEENAITKKMFGVNLNERSIDTYKGTNNITMRVGIGLQINE